MHSSTQLPRDRCIKGNSFHVAPYILLLLVQMWTSEWHIRVKFNLKEIHSLTNRIMNTQKILQNSDSQLPHGFVLNTEF